MFFKNGIESRVARDALERYVRDGLAFKRDLACDFACRIRKPRTVRVARLVLSGDSAKFVKLEPRSHALWLF